MNPFLRTTVVTAALLLAATLAHSQSRYTYSTAGDEVTDTQTGLTWRRCSEGQTWSGTSCTGTATIAATYTHEQALAHAKAQAGAAGWRLPSVKELSSIAEKTRTNPAIDTSAFPATPSGWYWSSTPYAGDSGYARYVNFYSGNVAYGYRYASLHVRLVR